jgi:hypothetical protein
MTQSIIVSQIDVPKTAHPNALPEYRERVQKRERRIGNSADQDHGAARLYKLLSSLKNPVAGPSAV